MLRHEKPHNSQFILAASDSSIDYSRRMKMERLGVVQVYLSEQIARHMNYDQLRETFSWF